MKGRRTALLITGSREASIEMTKYTVAVVKRAVERGWQLVCGDAEGVDFHAIIQACHEGLPFSFYGITNWPRHFCCREHARSNYIQVKAKGYLQRDLAMIEVLQPKDHVIAIWNGKSHGTKFTYDNALKRPDLKVHLRTFVTENVS